MQDKEFDRLFNSKLGDLEMEPSPMVWDNIAGELDGKKGKGGIAVYLSIAASVIVLVSAGLLFFNRTEPINLRNDKNNVAKQIDTTAKAIESPIPPVVNVPVEQIANVKKTVVRSAKRISATEPVKKATIAAPEIKEVAPEQQVIAAISRKEEEQPTMAVPDMGTALAIKTLHTEPQIVESVTVVTTTEEPVKTPVKRHGIRSLGGLINALVAKVDKRQDKLIEFTEDEEEGSNLTGVNLGLVKIKKQ